jgi:DNA invertase Pin-like site-specific DNA recombinase
MPASRPSPQDLTPHLSQLKVAGCEKIFREKITGTTADRLQLGRLMATLAPGDVVVIPAVDRLSRDTTDLLVIARDAVRRGWQWSSVAVPTPFDAPVKSLLIVSTI